uniref:Terpene synthase N-terminal domain-containing protein n=1 Tax=Brassica oleracea var. oleracea TaxID=109376 RepID=A0A0D3ADM7_BRAOL
MEASKMRFGLNTLPNVHSGPLCHKTNFSLIPSRLIQNNTLSSKKPTKHLICVKTESSGDLESTRPLTYFSPYTWGDYFLSVPVDDSAVEQEIEYVMKPKVRDILMCPHSSDKEKIPIVHLLISLAIAHYFESEIEEILHHAFQNLDDLISEKDDLETIAIMFKVFRLYGHKMSCDAFERFKTEEGKFKQILAHDVRGMLQLYESAHLGLPSEDIMDEALTFTRHHLGLLTGQETSPNLFEQIQRTLYRARYHNIEIVVAQQYISFYGQWWKEIGMAPKLSYIRDRIVEVFLFAVGMFFEPRYSLAKIHATKFSMLVTALDDTCDAYATLREVISLHDAFQRLKSLMILYLATSKWARAGHVPSFEDYMEVGSSASGLHDFAAYGYISMDDCDQKQLNEGEVANGVNCYMKQYGVTKEAAVEVLRKMERENYKIMMEEFVSSKAVPRQILVTKEINNRRYKNDKIEKLLRRTPTRARKIYIKTTKAQMSRVFFSNP